MSISAKSAAKRLRKPAGPTFIQRSRAVSAEQKAIWHNVTGAGKSHTLRQFLGLNDDDASFLGATLEHLVSQNLR